MRYLEVEMYAIKTKVVKHITVFSFTFVLSVHNEQVLVLRFIILDEKRKVQPQQQQQQLHILK